ncbi:MAG: hypothetical protein ABI777_12940 [Betaproteobacteria bacterium]
MNQSIRSNFARTPIAAAVGLALMAASAFAATTPNQMPGAGTLTTLGSGDQLQVNGSDPIPVTTSIIGLVSGARIDVSGMAVIT